MSERIALITGGICGILMILLGFGGVTFASGTRVGEYVLMLSTAPGLWQTVVLYKFLTRRERGLGALAMLAALPALPRSLPLGWLVCMRKSEPRKAKHERRPSRPKDSLAAPVPG